jgi:ABC-2 type transport system ATP-binding protein
MNALDIEGLTKVYRKGFWGKKHTALDGLSLGVAEGEIFGFIGANGAGKTTTFKILMGLTTPTAGSARILGQDIRAGGVRRRVGFLPEEASFYTYLTARELLVFYGRLQGLSPADVRARAEGIFETVGIGHAGDQRLGTFSKGMRQRFGIAQALVADPEILFLDEPLSGLDPAGRKSLKDLLVNLRLRGTTVFFSSHILSDAEAICDRIAVIDRGTLRALGRLDELLESRIRTFEIRVRNLSAEDLSALGAVSDAAADDGEGCTLNLSGDEDPDAWVGRIREKGGAVTALIPYRESLEEYFLRLQNRPGGPETEDG